MCVCQWVREEERETSSEKEGRMRTNRELHSSPIHRRIIQSDVTIHLCDRSVRIGPGQAARRCIIYTHTILAESCLHRYQAFISLWRISPRSTAIHSLYHSMRRAPESCLFRPPPPPLKCNQCLRSRGRSESLSISEP